MKLEDKIRPHALLWDCYNDEPEKYNHTNKLIKIADDYAIGFAEWIRKETYYEHLTKEFIYKRNVYASEKELLEIYKKEKGL
jgi:hypothetical protein